MALHLSEKQYNELLQNMNKTPAANELESNPHDELMRDYRAVKPWARFVGFVYMWRLAAPILPFVLVIAFMGVCLALTLVFGILASAVAGAWVLITNFWCWMGFFIAALGYAAYKVWKV